MSASICRTKGVRKPFRNVQRKPLELELEVLIRSEYEKCREADGSHENKNYFRR